MSPLERYAPDDPREWMNRARSNLALAKNRVPGAYLEDLCFEAQQAAEKAIKAVMIIRAILYVPSIFVRARPDPALVALGRSGREHSRSGLESRRTHHIRPEHTLSQR